MSGKPTIVIKESGLFDEGLLEHIAGWYVLDVPCGKDCVGSSRFTGVVGDWLERLNQERANTANIPVNGTINELIGSLKPAQLYAVLSVLLAIIVAISGASYMIGACGVQLGPERAGAEDARGVGE